MKINAYRSVNITDSFCNYLKKLKSEQAESRRLHGDGYKRNFVTDRLERNKENFMEITDFVNVKINGEMLSTNSVKFMSGIFKEELHIDFKFHNPSGQSLILRVTLFQFARAATTNKDKIVFINQSNQIGHFRQVSIKHIFSVMRTALSDRTII